MAEPGKRPARRRKTRPGEGSSTPESGVDAMRAGYAKSEVKNQKVRDSLEPLERNQRPTVVTVGAVFAIIVSLILWGSTIFALVTGAKVNGDTVNIAQWVGLASVFSVMALGMWRVRYWAVLGFQMLLVLLILACVLGLITAGTLLQMVSTAILGIGLGLLFFFMVKAMARIQMPQSPGRR